MLRSQVTPFGKDTIPLISEDFDHIPIWRPGPMEWVTQLVQDELISRSQFHLQRPYFQMGSHAQVPGDTAFGKDTTPLSSMGLDLIPIWWPDPMEWVTQLLQNDLISRPLIPPAKAPISQWGPIRRFLGIATCTHFLGAPVGLHNVPS
jgi:hypothetical protein